MAEWRTPVFDRTMDDVKSVDRTSAAYQKGALNADDLNRIEDNYKYLMAKLRGDAIFIPHRLRNFTETVLEYVEKENSVLPDGYTQVEYIESNGTQYIDTGFKPNQNTRVVMDIHPTSVTTHAWAFGVRTSSSANRYDFLWQNDMVAWIAGYSSTYAQIGKGLIGKTDRLQIDFNKNICTINGNSATITAGSISLNINLVLLACNTAGTISGHITAKLYSCKIYDNGTLVRNFIPCINASGVAGLYDLVNAKFYANAGSGTFTAGDEVPKLAGESNTISELIETQTTYTDWQEYNLPWLSEINRIRANYNALVRLFLVGLGFSEQKESNYLDYIEVNNLENIALIGKMMFENMEKEYRYCGTEESGGDRLL